MQVVAKNRFSVSTLVFIWISYTILHIILKLHESTRNYAGLLISCTTPLLGIVCSFYAIKLWTQTQGAAKKIIGFFTLSFCCIALVSIVYQLKCNVLHLSYKNPSILFLSSTNVPFLGYFVFQLMASVALLIQGGVFKNKSYFYTYVPIFVITAILLFIFWIVSLPTTTYSLDGFYVLSDHFFEITNFILVALCLAVTKNRGILYIFLAYLIDLGANIIMDYGMFAQQYGISSVLETTWVLFYLFLIYGLLNIRKTETYNQHPQSWVSAPDSIVTQTTFMTFILCMVALSVVAMMAYFMSAQQFFLNDVTLKIFASALVVCSIFTIVVSNLAARKLYEPLQNLKKLANTYMEESGGLGVLDTINYRTLEFRQLQDFFVKAFLVFEEKLTAEKQLSLLASQVAHDIRSPLAALQTVISKASNLEEESRILVRNAAERINDIANNLLTNNYAEAKQCKDLQLCPELMVSIIDSILSEKRMQFADKKIKFDFVVNNDARSLFANINSSEFKRMLSNLINNSVEAINHENGKITVNLFKKNGELNIEVNDNGAGIPKDIINKIGTLNFTAGKKDGHGIGLASAINTIKSWNGNYSINSKVDFGTTFTINLPLTGSPDWFLNKLFLTNTNIVILDDDPTVHDAWEIRFKPYAEKVKLQHFYKADELAQYLTTKKEDVILIDHELIGSRETGLDLIEKLGLASQAILVTSRYEDKDILERSKKLGIKIIPKNYVPYVEIEILRGGKSQPDAVLLDDDRLVAQLWQLAAEDKNIKLLTFDRVDDFMKSVVTLSKDTLIYIDAVLPGAKGEDIAKELSAQGFTNLYLSSGFEPHEFKHITWVKGIINKMPPF